MKRRVRGRTGDKQGARWPALDGLRAFAVLGVMAAHLGHARFFPGGSLGVDVFFVISGFLITSILLGERTKRGVLGLRRFYARRALRLFPALAVVLVTAAALSLADHSAAWSHPTLIGIPAIILYVGNWYRAFSPSNPPLGILGQTWSLAVEEQFYLLWPLLVVAVLSRIRDRRRVAILLTVAAVAVMAYRAVDVAHGWSVNRVSNGTDTHCDGLLLGCALSFWLSASPARRPRPRLSGVSAVTGAVVLLVVSVVVQNTTFLVDAGYPIAELATVALVWDTTTSPRPVLHRLLTARPLQWVGVRSYGLYLWHYPIYFVVANAPEQPAAPVRIVPVVILSFVAAGVSYRFIERPFLERKRRYEVVSAADGLSAGVPAPTAEVS